MPESSPSNLAGLRIDRQAGRRRRRSRWPGRILVLALVAGGAWLFQRPLLEVVDRLRLPEVEVGLLVRTSPSSASGARGAAANGYVVARTRAALSAEQPGRLVEMNVVEGTRVRAGDVVARLDATEQVARLATAEAEVAVARAALERARADARSAGADRAEAEQRVPSAQAELDGARVDLAFARREEERFDELVTQGVAEARRRDEVVRDLARAEAAEQGAGAGLGAARAALEAATERRAAAEVAAGEAEARLASAAARIAEAQAALEKTNVRAPFDGVVVLKEAEIGEVVSPNSQGGSNARGSVATMVDLASLEVQAEVPESTLAAVRLGGAARIYLDAFPSEPYAGRIDRIWPTADRTKATVEVRATFDAPDERLRPEMGARVVFLEEEPDPARAASEEPVLLMPVRALITVDGARGAFVVERGRVRFQAVTLGDSRGGRVVVEGGLAGDEQLVLDPSASLEDGARVRVKLLE